MSIYSRKTLKLMGIKGDKDDPQVHQYIANKVTKLRGPLRTLVDPLHDLMQVLKPLGNAEWQAGSPGARGGKYSTLYSQVNALSMAITSLLSNEIDKD